ncbi:MAG: LysR family transcriptional regulator [Gammaproteobacteria bacterium]|nr:MAG: LysR family transcriptional regulator [Gammaproteobacteria bacterium]
MNITLRQLKVFQAVARHLSFTRAAESLFLTQPAVSMQIRQLEEHVGLPLFEHVGKKVFLTPAGKEFLHYSQAILEQFGEIEMVVEELKGGRRGQLAIAVASTANYFAPQLLAPFSRRFPGIRISLEVTNREGLVRALEENAGDLVIMGRPPEGIGVVAESFMDNPLVVIAPTDHPLVGRKAIPFAALARETFLVREKGSGTRIAMERFFEEKGFQLSTGMEMSSNEAIKQAVQAGLGLGIVSIHTLALELETRRLHILDVEGFPILRHWYVVHRKGKRLSTVAQAFRRFVLEEARGLLEGHGRAA